MALERSVLSIALAVALTASAGCSLGSLGQRSKRSPKIPSSEIAALEDQILELQRQAAIAEVDIGRLQRRLTELESAAAAPSSAAAPDVTVSRSLPAEESVQAPAPAEPALEVSDLPPEPGTSPPTQEATESSPGPEPDATLTASAQALYDRGYTLFHRGRFVDSETAFQQFLSRYQATVLGDNAQFWIAEARYARGDVAGARAAYLETASRFPDGNKAPDALLKAGDCALELGDREGARQSFRALLDEFPGSAAAGAARERIGLLP